jgi:isopenicillin N synthase-like dioxygenase
MDADRVMRDERKVPVIDLGHTDRAAVLRGIDAACRDWGFFQVLGHGIPRDLLDAVRAGMHTFFAMPAPAKDAIRRTAENAWGFYDQELTKNRRDWKEIFDVGPAIESGPLAGFRPQWPASLPQFRPVMEAFFAACERVALDMVRAISKNLGMPADYLDGAFAPAHTSFLRLNHYPVCADPAPPDADLFPAKGQLGIHHHTDSGAVTVLLQDELPGLQVLRNGRWHLVQPLEGALVINIGDVVQVWSNDRYPAALHRVLANARANRFSAPFFFNPAVDAVYAPLPSACDPQHPPRYRPIHWGEFRAARAAGDYADLGEEIQISHYRVA